jgi:hypothetical protein
MSIFVVWAAPAAPETPPNLGSPPRRCLEARCEGTLNIYRKRETVDLSRGAGFPKRRERSMFLFFLRRLPRATSLATFETTSQVVAFPKLLAAENKRR